jgi:hypothetical protein
MRFFPLLTTGLLLTGCTQQPTQRQAPTIPAQPLPAPAPVAAAPAPTLARADTVPPYTPLWPVVVQNGQPVPVPPLVRIGGVPYRVQARAVADSTRPLRYLDRVPAADGSFVTDTLRLLRPDGQPQFTRRIRKSSLKEEIGDDLAVEASEWQPDFLGYLPQFNALAFELTVNPPDSDAGGSLLLLLDARTGQVRQLRLSRWTGGCSSPVALSEDGRTLLTSCHIIRADGRVVSLEKPDLTIGGTLLVNNSHVLVTYQPPFVPGQRAPTPPNNTRLLDLSGRQLAAARLVSLYGGGLGTQMLTTYLGQTRTYYLFDEEQRQLALLPHDQPSQLRLFKLNQLQPFQAPQRSTEVRFHLDSETRGTESTFYVDTLTQALRYQVKKLL